MRFSFKKKVLIASLLLGCSGLFLSNMNKASASSCIPPASDYGSVTSSITVSAPGAYRIWSRIQQSNNLSNSFNIEIDGTTCFNAVGGNAAFALNTWNWVDYSSGNSSNKASINLSSGVHTIKMIGASDGLLLDRIILTQIQSDGTTCTPDPSGTGDNCVNPPDTTPPVISVSSPASNATVSGTVQLSANITDNNGLILNTEFLIDGNVVSPTGYSNSSYNWSSQTVPNGIHSLVIRAKDSSGNVASATVNVTVANGIPDLIITGASFTPYPVNLNNAVTFYATVKNNGNTPSKPGAVTYKVDGVLIGATNDTQLLDPGVSRTIILTSGKWIASTGGIHTLTVTADTNNEIIESNESNNTVSTQLAVNVPDTIIPNIDLTTPVDRAIVSGKQVSISANAADTGGSNLARVEFYINSKLLNTDSTGPDYSVFWDTTTFGNGTYVISAIAYDGAGLSKQSTTRTVTVKNAILLKPGDANGDGIVDIFDFSILAKNYNQYGIKTRADGDFNGDGTVNIFDFAILAGNYGK